MTSRVMTGMRLPLLLALCAVARPAFADELTPAKKPADAGSPESAIKSFAVAPGLQVEVWAAEPHLANPVAFTFDDAGRAYVAETYRRRTSALDIRKYDEWKVPNLSLRSVEDRIRFTKEKFPIEAKLKPTSLWPDINQDGQFDWRDMTIESEVVRVIEDSNGDGKADQARVFADGFNSLETTVGAGVVSDGKGGVFYTCIPDLWHIAADGTKTKVLSGFGAHIVFSGHEMHGARMGPDGRLYFTIADTGARVTTKEGKIIDNPDSGAVFRCWPDGSECELFAKGLRNPQHLAFNDVGDLFTGDNNADGGDKARWIHVVQGGDYGWRIGWQFLPKLGLWRSEGMYELDVATTNPAILPPVAHIGHGPAGIVYYPGTGLPEQFKGHFFYADFPGGVRHFGLKPKGATYELADFAPDAPVLQNNQPSEMTAKLLWNLNPSDVQFAPGGGVMVLDWTPGWEKTGKGRIYRVSSAVTDKDELTRETQRLLREGFARKSIDELTALLGHADQRVRLGAQFALVDRAASSDGKLAIEGLKSVAQRPTKLLARLHAIWGLGIAGRKSSAATRDLLILLRDAEGEVRAQTLKVLSDSSLPEAPHDLAPYLPALLKDSSARVRFFAYQAARRLGWNAETLARYAPELDADAMLRHAFTSALASAIANEPPVDGVPSEILSKGGLNETLRVDALRKARRADIGVLVFSPQPQVCAQVARAIHDEPIPAAIPSLVKYLAFRAKPGSATSASPDRLMDQVILRAVNAAYRLGTAEAAATLASFATAPSEAHIAEAARLDALDALGSWGVDLGRDRVLGILVEGDGKRDRADGANALVKVLPQLFQASTAIRAATADAAGALKVREAEPNLLEAVLDAKADGKFRLASLRALAAIESPKLADAIRASLGSTDKALVAEARKLSSKLGGVMAVETNAAVLGKGTIAEQQEAIETIAKIAVPEADRVIAQQLDLLLSGKLPAGLHLDVLEAGAARSSEEVKAKVAAYEKTRNGADPLSRWQECLEGGDSKLGRVIFAEKAEAGCQRCHAVKKQGGDVGPDLAGIAAKHDRLYLLRAVVEPNADIAPGFDNVLVTLANGDVLAGMVNKEDVDTLTLKSPADGKLQVVKKADIKDRQKLPSAMPPALGDVLGKRALRDVVAYLAGLKTP